MRKGAVEAIKGLDGVRAVEVTGNSLVIKLEPGKDVAAEINSTLISHGIRVRSLKQEEVSLEDVFVALTGGE